MKVLFLSENRHHDKGVQIDALTQHPEIVTAQYVHVEELQHLTTNLQQHRGEKVEVKSVFYIYRRLQHILLNFQEWGLECLVHQDVLSCKKLSVCTKNNQNHVVGWHSHKHLCFYLLPNSCLNTKVLIQSLLHFHFILLSS